MKEHLKNHSTKITKHVTRRGYTLVELVVVIGLSALLLLSAVSLFLTTSVGGGKTASGEYTKQAGGQSLSQIEFLLRNSRKLLPNPSGQTCETALDSVTTQNLDGGTTTFSIISGKIASTSATGTVYLTPTDIIASVPSGSLFSCTPTTYGKTSWDGSPPRVTINFSLQKGSGGLARDIVTIPFTSTITLRNF